MCPSYMATRNEKDTTRARANILREILTNSEASNPFANEEIKEVMDLCLSCKGCSSECPFHVYIYRLLLSRHYFLRRSLSRMSFASFPCLCFRDLDVFLQNLIDFAVICLGFHVPNGPFMFSNSDVSYSTLKMFIAFHSSFIAQRSSFVCPQFMILLVHSCCFFRCFFFR